jgi:hypothetical protein
MHECLTRPAHFLKVSDFAAGVLDAHCCRDAYHFFEVLASRFF